jgi:hypothetical protein
MSLSFMRRTRARSDLEVFEEDLCLTSRCLSKRDDVDTSLGLRMNDRNGYTLKQTEGGEALFVVMKPIVLVGVGWAREYLLHVGEIEAVIPEIASAFRLIPGKSHVSVLA